MSGAHEANECAVKEEKISMTSNWTQVNSIAARGRKGSGRTCAGLFSVVSGGGAATLAALCPSSLLTYQPGGERMQENAKSTRNLGISDRQGNLS